MITDQNKRCWISARVNSFRYAFRGLRVMLNHQYNFMIHLAITVGILALGLITGLSATEWSIIIVTITLVLSLETMNTALEHFVDLVSPQFQENAGKVKDIAAAAVLIASLGAVVIGLLILGPKLILT